MTKTKYELMELIFLNKLMKSKLKNVFNTNYCKPKIKYLTFNINYFKEQKFHLNPQLN